MSDATQDDREMFTATLRRMNAEAAKLMAEQQKFGAEQQKLYAESLKLKRDRWLAPIIAVSGAAVGLTGAAIAVATLLLHH